MDFLMTILFMQMNKIEIYILMIILGRKDEKMKRKELEKEIGTLSNPSKMPAFAWGISAKKCITGAKLAKVKGTICNKCYALKGHYAFKNVFDAHELRRKAIEKNEWVDYMAELITQKYKNLDKSRHYHRWFDSGDLQSYLSSYENI